MWGRNPEVENTGIKGLNPRSVVHSFFFINVIQFRKDSITFTLLAYIIEKKKQVTINTSGTYNNHG